MRRQHFPGVAGWKHGNQESELQHVDDSKSGSVTTLPTSLTFVIYLLYIILCYYYGPLRPSLLDQSSADCLYVLLTAWIPNSSDRLGGEVGQGRDDNEEAQVAGHAV